MGGYVFVAGRTFDGDAAAQAGRAMDGIRAELEAAGGGVADIRKLTVYLTDRAWRAPVSAVVERHLGGLAPARTELIVAGLARPEALVAIEAEAVVT